MSAQRRRRMPSQREPVGRTKSEILLYIVDNPKASLTNIREYLRNRLNIRNQKVVRKHISDLVNDKIIEIRKAERRGLSDIYYVEKSFSNFKTSFNFLNDFYKPSFLGAKYARDMVSSDDFLTYGIINVVKEIFTEFLKLKDENYFNALIENFKRNSEDVSSKEIKEFKEMLESVKRELKDKNLDKFQNLLETAKPEDILKELENLLNLPSDFNYIFTSIINTIFPDKQRKEIMGIISTSPSATDYFLNLKSVDRLYLFMIVIRFYLSTLFMDGGKISLINEISKDESKLQSNLIPYITRLLSIENVSNDNPLLTILRSYFVVDAFNGNIVNNEYSNSVLKEILLPKVVQ